MEPRIRPLAEELVAKIAAGEVITSPVNVVKELVENSLDAKATSIHISIKDKASFIKVKDNGTGFHRDDLPLACARHATSKLTSMSDFETLENYGFRGEALSSISHVAEVIITSKKKGDTFGAKATYKDGQMTGCSNVSANDGTVIAISNLFYNFKERKANLQATFGKEYAKIIEVIQCYAIHCNFCSFHLEKDGRPDVLSGGNRTKIELVHEIIGRKAATNLLEVSHSNPKYEYRFDGLISNTSATLNRYLFILFINNRLVDCSSLKTTIKEIFADQLMKGSNPFVYLNLSILQKNLDVNLHPSKREVRFLNEDVINSEISAKIQQYLVDQADGQDVLRMNTSQAASKSPNNGLNSSLSSNLNDSVILNNIQRPTSSDFVTPKPVRAGGRDTNQPPDSEPKSKPKIKPAAYQKIHNDGSARKVSDMFAIQKMNDRGFRKISLSSLEALKREVEAKKDVELTYRMRQITLVGVLDHRRVLVQHTQYIMMLDFVEFSKAFFYQYYLKNFGNFRTIEFKEKIHFFELLNVFKDDLKMEFNVEEAAVSLIEKREMFADYFSMRFTEDGFLVSIPVIVDGYKPNLDLLPLLIWRLCNVEYDEEKPCFKMIGQAFADFYSRPVKRLADQKQNIQAVFSRFKEEVKPAANLKGSIKTISQLQELYKIFERC